MANPPKPASAWTSQVARSKTRPRSELLDRPCIAVRDNGHANASGDDGLLLRLRMPDALPLVKVFRLELLDFRVCWTAVGNASFGER